MNPEAMNSESANAVATNRAPATIVQKYGGSSVASPEKLRRVAELVVRKKKAGHALVVVVSAMGDTTDELLGLAKQMHSAPPRRELDMLVSCGERISMALLSMALDALGEKAISFTGSQSGILTTDDHFAAKITEVRPARIEQALADGHIVIVAGYQGMSHKREITTLGRGGSDTTAVALAAALQAEACEIYSDVDGVYSADPRLVEGANRLAQLSYAEMETFAQAGARVLNADAVAFAREAKITIHARKTGADVSQETVIDGTSPSRAVAGVTHKAELWQVTGAHTHLPATLERLARFNAAAEGLASNGREFRLWVDLANIPDHASLQLGQSQPSELVSLVGDQLCRKTAAIAAALALAPASATFFVEPHRLAVAVAPGQAKSLLNAWHRHFFEKRLASRGELPRHLRWRQQ